MVWEEVKNWLGGLAGIPAFSVLYLVCDTHRLD